MGKRRENAMNLRLHSIRDGKAREAVTWVQPLKNRLSFRDISTAFMALVSLSLISSMRSKSKSLVAIRKCLKWEVSIDSIWLTFVPLTCCPL